MHFTLGRLADAMREFVSALRAPETYAPLRNPYILFGFLWGIPVPLLGVLLLHQDGREAHFSPALAAEPLFWFLLLHPPVFAVVFGAMGTVRLRQITRIEGLLREREAEMQRLRDAHDELQQLGRLKDEFLGAVTHELKTPLVTIRGYAQMLEHGRLGPISDQQKHVLEVMQRNCLRLQQQIDLLLSASRNQRPVLELQAAAVPLAELVDEVLERHRPAALQKGVQLEHDLPPLPVSLWGDAGQLMEVLDNLLGNAIKFTEGGGRVRLHCKAPSGNRLDAEVSDTGCGIEVDAQPHVFERFRQADGSIRRRYGGSGLGLAIARENLAAHGCAIRVESVPGQGARFLFSLPVQEHASATEPGDTNKGA
jgi:signal transduction histidine kinase